jgi:hypothetical protein
MKFYIPSLILLLILVCCTSAKKTAVHNKDLTFNIIQRGNYNFTTNISDNYLLIEARLVNNTDSVADFLILSCAVYDNFISNSKSISILPNNCNRNTTFPIKLEPHQIFSVPLVLHSINMSDQVNNQLRIGFVLISKEDPKEPLLETINKLKEKKENLIWSNYFNFNSGMDPYLIE